MNKDFIKTEHYCKHDDYLQNGHYYGYRRNLLMLDGLTWQPVTTYFRIDKFDKITNGENESYKIYGRYLQQYREYSNSSTLATFSGESSWIITQSDIDEGNIWEMSREAMMETAMNISRNVIEIF